MKKQQQQSHTFQKKAIRLHKRLGLFIFALMLPFSLITQTVGAQSSGQLTAAKVCEKYADTSEKYACQDGWRGADCSDYLITHDEGHVTICQQASATRMESDAAGTTGDDTATPAPNPKPDPVPGENTSNSGGKDTLGQMIDQAKETQENQDKDCEARGAREPGGACSDEGKKNPDDIPDNTYGAYINGKGDKQAMRVSAREGKNNPVIIFFNGGGWHTDDGVGDKISGAARERGYTTIVATYRLGSSGVYYMYEDVMRAIRHVRNNSDMYGIDPSRIVVWGDSAGGSLAMRAAGSGQSGAAAAVGWSAPTNAYTALFRSPQAFAIGMDHSTCMPTDLNGVSNVIDILNGGEGNSPDDGGLANNGINNMTPLETVTQVLTLAQRAQQTSTTAQSLLSSASSGGSGESASESGGEGSSGDLSQNVRRLATKKTLECLDNFNTMSPALFASPLTPPTFLAGYDSDILVGPDQAYQLRDKLRSMGVSASTLILPGVVSPVTVDGENHLYYHEKFVEPSLQFLDGIIHPANEPK